MATITEDYVSFETAKLMREKGFDEPTLAYAYNDDMISYYSRPRVTDTLNVEAGRIPLPTLQMAMRWLREVHNISIEPLVDFGSGEGYWWTADVGYIKKDGLVAELCGYDSYEKAAEAAIKYCLENLI